MPNHETHIGREGRCRVPRKINILFLFALCLLLHPHPAFCEETEWDERMDFNNDNVVDVHDLLQFMRSWHAKVPANVEPTPTPKNKNQTGDTTTVLLPDLPPRAKALDMVYLEPGTFIMGSPYCERDREEDEGPIHPVTLTHAFYIGKYEVTQAQYHAVMGENPSFYRADDRPVEQVSWYDAARFCNRLNEMHGLQPIYAENGDWAANPNAAGFRLPTEAEWEYACRAGTLTPFYWGVDAEGAQIEDYAWYSVNSRARTHTAGLKKPNAWGLHDMSGNVSEWCQDRFDTNYYEKSPLEDPKGPSTGFLRVRRGGSWQFDAAICRSAVRASWGTDFQFNNLGFRLAYSAN
ncbi:SUMF1/EgtB/PvdO family nonheme iron enzyme [bacterium]|nr:SUMF1/EgtB/PvdO family nonheme iron enzyme [bacterium]